MNINDINLKSNIVTLNKTSDKIKGHKFLEDDIIVNFDYKLPEIKDYSKIMFFIGLSILLVCTILEIGMLYKIGKENKKNIKKEEELIVLSILDSLMLLQYQPFL